jgi:hypothetical protein
MNKPNPVTPRNTLGDISVLYVSVMARAIQYEGADHTDLFRQFSLFG